MQVRKTVKTGRLASTPLCFPTRPVSCLSRLACRAPYNPPLCRTSIRMASTIVGQSGRKYIQGEVLQCHRQDPKFNVYQAQSVLCSMPTSPSLAISDPSHSAPRVDLLSSSACLGRSLTCPEPSKAILQALVDFECTSITTKRSAL